MVTRPALCKEGARSTAYRERHTGRRYSNSLRSQAAYLLSRLPRLYYSRFTYVTGTLSVRVDGFAPEIVPCAPEDTSISYRK